MIRGVNRIPQDVVGERERLAKLQVHRSICVRTLVPPYKYHWI